MSEASDALALRSNDVSNMTTYWHFAQADEQGVPRLGYNDGREIRAGETLTVEGEPVLCEHGLHASERIMDALYYARGAVICEVTLGGTIVTGDDKLAATERTVLRMLDVETGEKLLYTFVRWCALQVIHLWKAPDVVRQYLETDDESLRAAARIPAWDAARITAWDAARTAARTAARDAAGAAARGTAWAAARDAQNTKLTEMVRSSFTQQEASDGTQ